VPRLVRYGPAALLAEYDSLDEVIAAAASARQVTGVEDVVPAARTVLARFAGPEPPGLRAALTDPAPPPVGADRGVVHVPVIYDGADLDAVASATGLGVDDVIALHSGPGYRAAFCGFAPGFAYLAGLDRRLWLARRPTPRTRVPAGAVAIAAEFSAVYPTASPGGWHLLGHTPMRVFDIERRHPAAIEPGTAVRFEPV
jgi:5-oxoprolinase (ATP-hydrolysing) subunit B